MFATLIGPYPRVLADGTSLDELERQVVAGRLDARVLREIADECVRDVVGAQESAGLALVSDGQVRHSDLATDVLAALPDGASFLVEEWAFTARLSQATVKQVVPGPYSLGWLHGDRRPERAVDAARALNGVLRSLATAGCAVAEVHEPEAVRIGGDDAERALFMEAHARLLDGVEGMHCSLALMGGEVEPAGARTLLAAPYASYAFDLLRGPEAWRVIAQIPRERGVVCGVVPTEPATRGDLALMVWAAHYAASTAGRGLARVALATSGGLRDLDPDAARAKLERLGEAARLAVDERTDDLAATLERAREADEGERLAGPTRTRRDGRWVRGLPGAAVPGRPPRSSRPRTTDGSEA